MKSARHVVSIAALSLGISGLLLGFGLWLYPGNEATQGPGLVLPVILGGLIAWWLGCRLAMTASRPVCDRARGVASIAAVPQPSLTRHAVGPQIMVAPRQVAAGKGAALSPVGAALEHEVAYLAESRE